MENNLTKKPRLGEKEKEVLEYLKQFPNGIWKEDVIRKFSWTKNYDGVVLKRLQRLQEKGYIKIVNEINPSSGRSKQRVYLKE